MKAFCEGFVNTIFGKCQKIITELPTICLPARTSRTMQISRDELERKHLERRERFRKWFGSKPSRTKPSDLKKEAQWWETEMEKDFEKFLDIEKGDILTIPSATNIMQSTFYLSRVLLAYATLLENKWNCKKRRKKK